jgi:hypothetical protein
MTGMVATYISAVEPEPIARPNVPDDGVVVQTMFISLLLMAIFTAVYVFRTRPQRHPLRVVRRPR